MGIEFGDKSQLTVREAIERLFPCETTEGSNEASVEPDSDGSARIPYIAWPLPPGFPRAYDDPDYIEGLAGPYAAPPRSPFDLFAATAYLLELSGAYHHVVPAPPRQGTRHPRLLYVTEATVKECRKEARTLRRRLDVDNTGDVGRRAAELTGLLNWWDELIGRYWSDPVYRHLAETDEPPAWWRLALELMIITDEAAVNVGLDPIDLDPARAKRSWPWFMSEFESGVLDYLLARERDEPLPPSLSSASTDLVCVLPKARTSPVGCTLRSLSHHLALLPPRGVARARWLPLLERGQSKASADTEFNLLLVPFPFSVSDREFVGSSDYNAYSNDWRFFSLKHGWQTGYKDASLGVRSFADVLVDFVAELARQAIETHEATRIDAVVFPEAALDLELFRAVYTLLPKKLPELRLLISGLSTNEQSHGNSTVDGALSNIRQGNFVGVASIYEGGLEVETIREKHHRWLLDRSQITAYGLQSALDPRCSWWEDIALLSRRVDFTVFKSRSVLAAMICEDLARVDPCHELLRSIGPNLVVALLLDAPQLRTRWPARYATILAEDPGSSVLTLTSRGLMTRQMLIETWPASEKDRFVIALWRDDYGEPLEIECPLDAHGVWLKLWGRRARDKTLDGRVDNGQCLGFMPVTKLSSSRGLTSFTARS